MQPNPRHEMAEVDEGDDWIVPYADMVTLLLCFFILFFNQDVEVTRLNLLKDLRADLTGSEKESAKALSGFLKKPGSEVGVPGVGETENEASERNVANLPNSPQDSEQFRREQGRSLNLMEADLRASVEELNLKAVKVKYERQPHKLIVRIWEQGLFEKGGWKISPLGFRLIKKLRARLKPYEQGVLVQVVGHSDSSPVVKNSAVYNNVNLSGLRALTASNILLKSPGGLSPTSVQALGLGASQTLVRDRTPSGEIIPEKADINRRIELWISQPKEGKL